MYCCLGFGFVADDVGLLLVGVFVPVLVDDDVLSADASSVKAVVVELMVGMAEDATRVSEMVVMVVGGLKRLPSPTFSRRTRSKWRLLLKREGER